MILSAQSIRSRKPIEPFCERSTSHGMTYGVGPAGYDVRIAETISLKSGGYSLASTVEQFSMPDDLIAFVHDKSTWARRFITLQNTVIEPGWRGFLTLEITNHSAKSVIILAGSPIAQIVFHELDAPTDTPYGNGKYQDQESGSQDARLREHL